MSEATARPLGVTLLAALHIVVGSLVLLWLAIEVGMTIAGGIPMVAMGWILLAGFLGPGVGNALLRGRPWAWSLASFGYACAAVAGALATPALLGRLASWPPSSALVRGFTIGQIALATLIVIVLFTGRVVDHFVVPRRTRWAKLLLEVVVAAGLAFGVQFLSGLQPDEDLSALLQKMGDRRANAPEEIVMMLAQLEDGSVEERVSAAWALGRAGRGDVLPQLLTAVHDDRDVSVRINAIAAASELSGKELQDDLVGLLADPTPEVRQAALRALADAKFAGAVESVGALLSDADLRSSVVDALGSMGTPETLPFLLRAATDPDEDIRSRVAFALGKLRDPRALTTLRELSRDASWSVRANAAQALGMVGDAAARADLQELMSDRDERVQGAAASALAKLN